MQLDIVTPERQIFSSEVASVQIPGMAGDMTILGAHAPTVTTLRPGFVTVTKDGARTQYLVTGGFAEISGERTSILAELALAATDVTHETLEKLKGEAEVELEIVPEEGKIDARQRINDLSTLIAQSG